MSRAARVAAAGVGLATVACGAAAPPQRPGTVAVARSAETAAPASLPAVPVITISGKELFVDEQAIATLHASNWEDALNDALTHHALERGVSSEAVLVADGATPYRLAWIALRELAAHRAAVVHVFIRGGSIDVELGPELETKWLDGETRANVSPGGVSFLRANGPIEPACAPVPSIDDTVDVARVRACAERIAAASPSGDTLTVDGTGEATFGDVMLVVEVSARDRRGPIFARVRFGPVFDL